MASRINGVETIFHVNKFAKIRAASYGEAIGRKPAAASRKLRAILQALLDTMEIGEVEVTPMPREDDKEEIFVLKKVGKHEFSTTIKQGSLFG